MPLWKNTQHSFAAGQLDTHVMGRQDMDKYAHGATLLKNFLVRRQGCISKRRGTDLTANLDGLLGTTYDGTPITPNKMRLVPVTNGDDGRYVILSGGIGFVANRDGVLTSDNRHVRSIVPYVAFNQDGNPTVIHGKDTRYSAATPVDVIHRISAGNYRVSRHETLQAAFDAAVDGDTVRLHANLLLDPAVVVTSSNSWSTDAGASATVTWDGDHAGHPNRYKVVTGGSTYYSRESDGYGDRSTITYNDRFVTCTLSWSFTDGKSWTVSHAGGTFTFTRDNGGTTVTATKSGSYYSMNVTFTDPTTSQSVTATGTWSFSGSDVDPNATYTMSRSGSYYWRVSDGTTDWLTDEYVTSYATTVTVVSHRTTVTEAAKAVTLDLYGYKITTGAQYGIHVRKSSVTLVVDSARMGAKFVVRGGSGDSIGFNVDSRITGVKSGSLHLAGEIEYDLIAGEAGHRIVLAKDSTGVTVDAGTFTVYNLYNVIILMNGGPLVVNGGRFVNEVVGDHYVQLIRLGHDTGVSQETTATINGGEFVNLNTCTGTSSREYRSYIICNHQGKAVIYGGRFTFADPSCFACYCDYRGHTFWNNAFLRIVRGEFSLQTIKNSYDDHGVYNEYGIGYYMADGSVLNASQPNAEGFYGVKVEGEGDYAWDGTSIFLIPYRFAVPYADADLADLCIRQSGDTLFVAHRDYPPAKIYFDKYGKAYFEELTLDNTDHAPPVIESAAMSGNEPVETDWPSEFPYTAVINGDTVWITGGVPSWIKNHSGDVSLNGSSKAPLEHLKDFVSACQALGTVTDAGFSGNDASSDDDGSWARAASFTCTSVEKNMATGRKTTTVSVLSFTSSRTVEVTTSFVDGVETSSTPRKIDTFGVASNSARASSVLVPRTVRYVATYVKDGMESRPSAPVAVDYDMPWANNAVVNITLGKGANASEPEYYNVYKDNGNGYGLIATSDADRIIGGISGSVDTYPLFMPDNTGDRAALVCAADFEERRGWATGDILRKMVSKGKDAFTTSPANDICLISTAANSANGIKFEFPSPVRCNSIAAMLDGRIYDKAMDASYLIISTNRVTCEVEYKTTSGATYTISQTKQNPRSYSWDGIAGGVVGGVYVDWLRLQRKAFTAPNGDTVYGHLYGRGDCSDEFNEHLRALGFSFENEFNGIPNYEGLESIPLYVGVVSIKFTFSESVYNYWPNNQQGCIHAIHFHSRSSTVDSGMAQDDYINPDMTVTPPNDKYDPHFGAADEYPGCVGIYGQRLVFASTRSSPSTIWMSRIADLYNFTAHESIREDDALELTLAATEFPNINHLVMGRDLMLFGDGGEWLISPISGNALTYKTASAKLQSMVGSDRALQPLQLADETLFAERGGTCLRSINYNYTSDSYQSNDLSVIAQSIFRANAIVSMAYKQHPDSIVECVLADGRVATLVYMKEQEVAAWSVQELGGGWKAREIVTPKCIVNGTTEMMLLVEKDGAYQLWKVRDDSDELAAARQVVLDGLHVEQTDTAETGEVAVALGDGTYAVGWPVVSEFVSVRPEPERGATAQMEIKNATESELRVIDASTFSVKPYAIETGWREVTLPVARDGTAVMLAERDCKRLLTGTNSRDGRIHVRHAEPWPLTILSISNTYQIEYENEDGKGDGQ